MKERDRQLLMVARILDFEVHTPFGSVPFTLKREANGTVKLEAHLSGVRLVDEGDGFAIIADKKKELAFNSARSTLMDTGILCS